MHLFFLSSWFGVFERNRDRVTRQHYYFQLRENVLRHGQPATEESFFRLAALALQAELGDYDADRHRGAYFDPQHYFPQWVRTFDFDHLAKNVSLIVYGFHRFWNAWEWTTWCRTCRPCIEITSACRRDPPSCCTSVKLPAVTPITDCTCTGCAVPKRTDTADPWSGVRNESTAAASREPWTDPPARGHWTERVPNTSRLWNTKGRRRAKVWNAIRANRGLWNGRRPTLRPCRPADRRTSARRMCTATLEPCGSASAAEESTFTRYAPPNQRPERGIADVKPLFQDLIV